MHCTQPQLIIESAFLRANCTHPDKAEQRQPKRRIQDKRKVSIPPERILALPRPNDILADVVGIDVQPAVEIFHNDNEERVGEEPHGHEPGTEGLVLVVQSGLLRAVDGVNLLESTRNGLLERGIHVLLGFGGIFNCTSAIAERGFRFD